MNIQKIKQLEMELESKSFYKTNVSKYVLWKYSSYLFQLLNIVLCFFGLYLFLDKTIETFPFKKEVLSIISGLVLVFWEYLKRIQIRDLTIIFIKNENGFNKNNLTNLGIGLFLIICSSLIAINGGNELSNKNNNIIQVSDNNLKTFTDSINSNYTNDINKLQSRIDYVYQNNVDKNNIKRPLTKSQERYVREIDNKIILLKNENSSILSEYKLELSTEKIDKVNKNDKVVLIFIITSLLFEVIILISILYCAFFDYKSYFEIKNTEEYRKNEIFNKYLSIIFDNGKNNIGDKLDAELQIKEFIKIKYKNTEYFKDFFVTLISLKIIETRSDKRRYFTKNYQEAKKEINKQFEI